MIAQEIAAISLDAQRRRLERIVGRQTVQVGWLAECDSVAWDGAAPERTR